MVIDRQPTKAERVLAALKSRHGEWVPMPDLAAASNAYAVHSRVSELRQAGHDIKHQNKREGREVHSFYMLVANYKQKVLEFQNETSGGTAARNTP